MKNKLTPAQTQKNACLVSESNKVVDISDGFLDLTEFSKDEIINKDFSDVLLSLLRLNYHTLEQIKNEGIAECFLFTKSLEPIDMTVSLLQVHSVSDKVYTFTEKPNSRLADKLMFAEHFFAENIKGVAIFSVPDLILLKSNQKFIDTFDPPYNIMENSIGRPGSNFPKRFSGDRDETDWDALLKTQKTISMKEIVFKGNEGELTYWDVSQTPVFENGKMKYIFEVIEDVTEKVLDRQEKEKPEKQFRRETLENVVENMTDQLLIFDKDGRYNTVNKAARNIYGPLYGGVEIVGDGFLKSEFLDINNCLIPADDIPARRILKGEKLSGYRMIIKSGKRLLYTEINGNPIYNDDGHFIAGVMCCRNITRQVRDEIRIKKQNERLKLQNDKLNIQAKLLNLSNEAIFAWGLFGTIFYWNTGAEKMYGYSSKEAVGHSTRDLLKTVFSDGTENIESILKRYGFWKGEIEHITKDGRKLIIETSLQTILNEHGQMAVLETNRDITQRKQIEDSLRQSEQHLRLAAEGAAVGTYAYDFVTGKETSSPELLTIMGIEPDDSFISDNGMFYRYLHPDNQKSIYFTNLHRDEMNGIFNINLHPDDAHIIQSNLNASLDPHSDGSSDFDFRVVISDGSIRWLHMQTQLSFHGDGENSRPQMVTGAVIDITKRVLAEEHLREMSEQLLNIMESTDDLIWSVDRDYKLIFCNTAFKNFSESIYGCNFVTGVSIGDVFPREAASVWTGFFERTIKEGKFRIDVKSYKEDVYYNYAFNPVYVGSKLLGITVFGKNITERMRTESEMFRLNNALENQIKEQETDLREAVADFQTFSLIVSHDLKTPLRTIENCAKLIADRINAESNTMEIRKICADMTAMIDKQLKYAATLSLDITKKTVDVRKMINSVYNEIKAGMPQIRSVLEYETGLPHISADKILLRQALCNIISNALKFSSTRETAKITVGCKAQNGEYVFYFKDNGVGFDMLYANKLFCLFERLHPEKEFEGSGIGLATVRRIIQRHGGRTWIEGRVNEGAVLYFTFPIQNQEGKANV